LLRTTVPLPAAGSPRRALVFAGIVFVLAARSVVRNAVWWSDADLFANSLAVAPKSAKAEYNMGWIHAAKENFREALRHYTRAASIYPRYWDAWAGKGRMEKELGNLAAAEASYRRSIEINPDYENGYFGLGTVREARGDWVAAWEAYRLGAQRIPTSLPLAYRFALVESRRNSASADAAWRRALKIGWASPVVRADHARYLKQKGKLKAAAAEAREALRRDPRNAAALRVLVDIAEERGARLSEALARERLARLTRDPADSERLRELARDFPGHQRRFHAASPRGIR
jgi:tetratricopeptide (TPR) repeat protein